MSRRDQKLIGYQAELLVQYKLSKLGHIIHRVDDCPYDLIGQVGEHVVRIQVKGTDQPQRCGSYKFQIGKGSKGKKPYLLTDFDIYALVSLRMECVYYMPLPVSTTTKRVGVQKFNEDMELKTWRRCVERVLEERL